MSKVSVTGSKRVLSEVVDATHDLNLLHVTEYDGAWEGFEPGEPAPGAEDASEKLVTVRSLESILSVDADDAGPRRVLDDDELEAELAEVRDRVNELDDRRDELGDELRAVEESIEAAEPFVDLGIDLDLLRGYEHVEVAVGEGDADAVERALVDAAGVGSFELYAGDETDVLAVVARPAPTAAPGAVGEALVGTEFAALEVPDAEGPPEEHVADLERRRERLTSEIAATEDRLEEVRAEAAGFLLAAEEELAVDVERTEAPLSFATTENAFVAEGWIPSERYTEFSRHVSDAVDGHVEIEELERASFGADGTEQLREELPGSGSGEAGGRGQPAATDGGGGSGVGDARADGGNVVMRDDDPPVVQDNPDAVRPFELLVRAVGRPTYSEFDPTVILFLTFPAFFGFMIGDLGYGLLYTGIGYALYSRFESPGFRSMGGITVAAGLFTMLFGVLYGEFFGLHLITDLFWVGTLGLSHPPIEKGLSPDQISWAQAWLVVSLLVGILHLNVGYLLDFVENLEFHGAKEAVLETGSWILMMNGLWIWVFSRTLTGSKPAFLFSLFDGTGTPPEASGEFAHAVVGLGFNGFPAMELFALPAAIPILGGFPISVPLLVFFLGLGLLAAGEPVEVVEFLQVLVNVLSYTRIAAVLLAKAGMAFTVNLLVFGAYEHDGAFHFLLGHGPEWAIGEYGAEAILFPGLVHSGAAAVLVGLVVLLLGHLLVLALGVTSAGLQAVRLEYVEFFGKFFEGGGREYEPFGHERRHTAEE
jgi:V/A-type H+-transporting ATPase subunit I